MLSVFVTIIVLIIMFINPDALQLIELKTYDLRMQLRGSRLPSKDIAIVAVDEKSLGSPLLGRWPWSRARIADIIKIINNAEAKVIVFDMVFAEPDKTGMEAKTGLEDALQKLELFNLRETEIPEAELNKAIKIITSLKYRLDFSDEDLLKLSGLLNVPRSLKEYREYLVNSISRSETDDYLAGVLKPYRNVVLGYYFKRDNGPDFTEDETFLNSLALSKIKIIKKIAKNADVISVPEYKSVVNNIPAITDASSHFGFFNAEPDADGAYRWANLVASFNGDFYPSLPLEAAGIYFDSPIVLHIDNMGIKNISVGRSFIPADEMGRMLVNFYGKSQKDLSAEKNTQGFKYYSAIDVLNNSFPPDAFKNKIVFFGTTAIGIYDIRPTPYDNLFPGVEIHASVLSNILNKEFLVKPSWGVIFDLCIIIMLGLMLGLLFPGIRANIIPVFLIGFVVMYYFLDWFIFKVGGVWLSFIYPNLEIITVSFAMVIFKYMTEEKTRKEYKHAFQHYLSPNLVDEILKDPSQLRLGGEKKELSVMFSDIRGFTSLSEGLTPETVVSILNEYLTPMTNVVFNNGGLLNKYMGDAIMAVFGAPIYNEKHAVHACNTALGMLAELKKLHNKWRYEKKPLFDIGVGINTGFMHIGNMGSKDLFDYTVIGDAVNLASRLEGINKIYGTSIIISEHTYAKTGNNFICREIDLVRVKGKATPVRVYELVDLNMGNSPEWITYYESGLKFYRERKWQDAISAFEMVLSLRAGDGPAAFFVKRCRLLKENAPGSEWEPILDISEK